MMLCAHAQADWLQGICGCHILPQCYPWACSTCRHACFAWCALQRAGADRCSVCVQWGWLQGISYLTYFRYTTSGMLRLQYTDRNDGCGLDVPSVPAMPPSQAGFAYPNNSTAMPPVPAHVDPCQQVGARCSVMRSTDCCHSKPAAAEALQQDCTLKSHAWLSDHRTEVVPT